VAVEEEGQVNHITQAKRKLKALLLESLPAILSAADDAAGDGITTPGPAEIHTTDAAELGDLPSLELIVTDSTPMVDSFAQIYRHRLVIGVTCGSSDQEEVAVFLERYIWALRRVARDSYLTPVEGTGPIDTGGEQYSPLVQRPETVENPFVKGVFIETYITTAE
jgi:hypothetical protein